jgi:glycosyltransferase involved in cell wall biosynthesis
MFLPMKISVVIPAHNEERNIPQLLEQIRNSLPDGLHEIIVVDDGSEDGTLEAVATASQEDPRIKYISLSRNFGHQAALRAGLRSASGDCVIAMDADLQHPPRLLPAMVEKWKEGFKIVLTIRKDAEETSAFKRLTSAVFYWAMNAVSDVSMDPGGADFRLLDKKVVEVINGLSEHDFFLRGIIPWTGFPTFKMSYTPDQRLYGSTKYSLRKMISFAASGVIANSIHPLRLATMLAVFIAGLCALYAVYAITIFFTSGRVVPGWTSVALVVSLIGSLQLLVLGVLGEYVGRILRETRKRPGFIVSRSSFDDDEK